jgi:hypothetical protein
MKQDNICNDRTVKVYAVKKFMTSQGDEVVFVTGYSVSQKIRNRCIILLAKCIYFLKYVMLCGTT